MKLKLEPRLRIPVEVCMSSNVICSTVPTYEKHHAGLLHNKVPLILCTDDKGVFCCTLSGEYRIAAQTFHWDRETLFNIARDAVNHCFAREEEKDELRKLFSSWRIQNQALFS